MPTVETMRGPIDSAALGRVLMHEHVFLIDFEYVENYRPDYNEDEAIADAVEKLEVLKALGIDTIVDLTVLGLGRHVKRIAKVAEKTGINIVVATGAYTFDEAPHGFEFWGPGLLVDSPSEPMVDCFVRDITEGIAGTSIKAGVLKCAIDAPGLKAGVERVMRAVAKTHMITGAPISVHTAPAQQNGLIVQQIMEEEGVDLRDVIIGHSGDTTDIDYLMRLADRGSMLGMDRFGVHFVCSTEDRVNTIVELTKRGYADRIVLSHDCACWSDFFPKAEMYGQFMPHHNYRHICEDVIPMLREGGVSESDIDHMFIDNPRRHFEGAAERFAARN
ncbi:MAG: phosphotriesterase [Novosphingobium sp.]